MTLSLVDYKCVRCSKEYELSFTNEELSKVYDRDSPPQFIASEYPCEDNGMCDLTRVWNASFGIGQAYTGSATPARSSVRRS